MPNFKANWSVVVMLFLIIWHHHGYISPLAGPQSDIKNFQRRSSPLKARGVQIFSCIRIMIVLQRVLWDRDLMGRTVILFAARHFNSVSVCHCADAGSLLLSHIWMTIHQYIYLLLSSSHTEADILLLLYDRSLLLGVVCHESEREPFIVN